MDHYIEVNYWVLLSGKLKKETRGLKNLIVLSGTTFALVFYSNKNVFIPRSK